jgi:hypothetical protein
METTTFGEYRIVSNDETRLPSHRIVMSLVLQAKLDTEGLNEDDDGRSPDFHKNVSHSVLHFCFIRSEVTR